MESATSRVGSGTVGVGLLADRGDAESRLRRTVVAGPGGPVEVDDTVLGGVLGSVAGEAVIASGLSVAGHVDQRSRVLTGAVTVAVILGLCLFRRENYDLVLARVLAGSPRRVIDGGPPTGQALSPARTRLALDSMRAVFEQAAAVMPAASPGGYAFGLLLTAFDGTVFDLAATADIAAEFATPSGGRFPQARLVTLIGCGTRWVIAARLGSSALSEQHARPHRRDAVRRLRDGPSPRVRRDAHLPADQDREPASAAPARHPRPAGRVHPDRHRRSRPGPDLPIPDPDHPARPPHIPRRPDRRGLRRTVAGRSGLPQGENHPPRSRTRPRGQTPNLAVQEIWGLLTVYNALVSLAVTAAITLDVDPDEISFAAVVALTRTNATTRPKCVQCGHRPDSPTTDLITAITTQPRNRTNRQRSSPRTKTQRQTERTRNVSYTITITTATSNLPKDQ